MLVVIAGCGRVGGGLAEILAREGHDIVVVDSDAQRLAELSPEFAGEKVYGDVTDVDVLRDARCDIADAFVAALGDDNSNIMAAQLANTVFGVKRVIVRVKDPRMLEAYADYKFQTVSATGLAAHAMADMLRAGPGLTVRASLLRDQIKVVEFTLPSWKVCRELAALVDEGHLSIAMTVAGGKVSLSYDEEALAPEVQVVALVEAEYLARIARLLE